MPWEFMMALPIRLSMSAFLAARLADHLAAYRPIALQARRPAAAQEAKARKEAARRPTKQFEVFRAL